MYGPDLEILTLDHRPPSTRYPRHQRMQRLVVGPCRPYSLKMWQEKKEKKHKKDKAWIAFSGSLLDKLMMQETVHYLGA